MVLQFLSSAKLITKPNAERKIDESGQETYYEDPQNPIIKLQGASFFGVCWPGVRDLNEIDLTNTDLRALNFRKADLRQANFRHSQCEGADLGNVIVDTETDFRGSEGNFAELRKRRFAQPLLPPPSTLERTPPTCTV
jgi:hypothetical protein